jgi:hypothetical protein
MCLTSSVICSIIESRKGKQSKNKEDKEMTNMEVRKEVKALVIRKGLENIINADLNEIQARTGAECMQIKNALNYFAYSPQAAKYRK